MAESLVVVDASRDWRPEYPDLPWATAHDYLTREEWARQRELRVINLCHDHRYQSVGYYCSLLAEARGHRVIPSARTGQDLSRALPWAPEEGLSTQARRWLNAREEDRLHLDVYFGQCDIPALAALAGEAFAGFQSPLLRLTLERAGEWRVRSLRVRSPKRLSLVERERFASAMAAYLTRRWRSPRLRKTYRHDLAILHEPGEALPPSNRRALEKFMAAARRQGMDAELITRRDFPRLGEFDALFIRTTTQVNHYTYRFARRGEREGLVVIDDSESILRCTNKVYLAEVLARQRIPAPPSVVLNRGNLEVAEARCGYPLVLKVPDGSFSRGVFKAENRADLERMTAELFAQSDLLLAQRYTFTPFDWRVGILGGRPLYVSQYFMARDHWQIVKHGDGGSLSGNARTLSVADAPDRVIATALAAAKALGTGLYGVDLKETPEGVLVIEVNDNPSIDAGVEDAVLKDGLYDAVMGEFVTRLEG